MTIKFYDADQLQDTAYARVLLTGDRKAGKTVSVLTTAPGPICVLNCDGAGAPMAAKRFGPKELLIADVETPAMWEEGCKVAVALASDNKVKTIVVDTITLLINDIIAGDMAKRYNGFDIWRETLGSFMRGFKMLKKAEAHVVLVAHFDMSDGQLTLDGKLKKDVPALVHDIVHLDFNNKRDPKRCYQVGPSANGLSGGRNSDENKLIPADFSALLTELGYAE